MSKENKPERKTISTNRRAYYDYEVFQKYEAGIILTGSEVKSLRIAKSNIAEAYASPQNNRVFIHNLNIPGYNNAFYDNHEPKRPRELLLNKREIQIINNNVARKGYTLVPLEMYFNLKGFVKVEIALARGKKNYDKRGAAMEDEWKKERKATLSGKFDK